MRYQHQDKVNRDIAAKSIADIEQVNSYLDNLKGTVVSIQRIRAGQQGAYQDTVYESIIFCHQPNCLTTNAPLLRSITRDEAKAIARVFVGRWKDDPVFLDARLETLEPLPNPCGLEEFKPREGQEERSSTWRVVIREPYND